MSLSYREVAEILKVIDASSLEEVVLELQGIRLVIRRGGASGATVLPPSSTVDTTPAQTTGPTKASQAAISAEPNATKPDIGATATNQDGKTTVCSPMVGTFYRRPSPDEETFVKVDTRITAGDPLCMIEVMKLYTTIEATGDGIVEAILAEDGKLVEFDQPLFVIRAI